jgi:hypothetical protein
MNSLQFFLTSADQRPWLNTTLRSLLAIVGGYWLAALSAATLALGLSLPRSEAVLAAMMASFVVYLLAALWVFAASTLARACGGLSSAALMLGLWFFFLSHGVSA